MKEIMEVTRNNTPPIMFMVIDTANKTDRQLINEIENTVDAEISKQLEQIKDKVTDTEFKKVARKLAVERENIIRQFTFQIKSRHAVRKTNRELAMV